MILAVGHGGLGGLATREAYDLISWDPRGVGKSTAVTCFKSVESYMSFAAKLGLKKPNATARMIAGATYPINTAEVRVMLMVAVLRAV